MFGDLVLHPAVLLAYLLPWFCIPGTSVCPDPVIAVSTHPSAPALVRPSLRVSVPKELLCLILQVWSFLEKLLFLIFSPFLVGALLAQRVGAFAVYGLG